MAEWRRKHYAIAKAAFMKSLRDKSTWRDDLRNILNDGSGRISETRVSVRATNFGIYECECPGVEGLKAEILISETQCMVEWRDTDLFRFESDGEERSYFILSDLRYEIPTSTAFDLLIAGIGELIRIPCSLLAFQLDLIHGLIDPYFETGYDIDFDIEEYWLMDEEHYLSDPG